jgi:hypothetical protein
MSLPIEFDDELFFDRLQGMQFYEQEEILRRRINELKESRHYADEGSRGWIELTCAQRKCEAELHRVAQVLNRMRWGDAVRTVLGQEAFEAVKLEVERMAGFPYSGNAQ